MIPAAMMAMFSMTMAVVTVAAAAVLSMAVTAADMSCPVMIAHGIGIIVQGTRKEGLHLHICISRCSGEQTDPRLCQCISGTAADISADQDLHAPLLQKSGQCSMTGSIGIHDLRGYDLSIFCLIDLKLFRMAKMSENLAI